MVVISSDGTFSSIYRLTTNVINAICMDVETEQSR